MQVFERCNFVSKVGAIWILFSVQKHAQVLPMKANGEDHNHCKGRTYPQGSCWLPKQFFCEWIEVAKKNAHPLSNIIAIDVEDFDNTWCNVLGRFSAYLAY